MSGLEYVTPLADLYPEPIPGYKFWVFLQTFTLGFSKISNLETAIETEPFHEGGVNHKVYSLNKALSGEKVMVLERGVANRGLLTKYLTNTFRVGNRIYGDIFIMVFGRDQCLGKMYLVNGCTVKKWSLSELNALSSELLIERFEITYETLEDFPLTTEIIDAAQKSIKLGTRESISDMFKKGEQQTEENSEGNEPGVSPGEYFKNARHFEKKKFPLDPLAAEKNYPEEHFLKQPPPKDAISGAKDYPEEYFEDNPKKETKPAVGNYPEDYFKNGGKSADEIRKSDKSTGKKLKTLANIKKK